MRVLKRLVLGLLVSALVGYPALAGPTVVLVRHAEKADASADPALSDAGQARAAALAAALNDARPPHVLVTPLRRTRDTAAPVTAAAGLTPEAVSLDGGADVHVARLVERVRALPDDATVLIVGHSNTVPKIARALGAASTADILDCEYDGLIVLDADGQGGAVSARYGAPSAC